MEEFFALPHEVADVFADALRKRDARLALELKRMRRREHAWYRAWESVLGR